MNNKRVTNFDFVFAVSVGENDGFGHFARCKYLAQALLQKGASCAFFLRGDTSTASSELALHGIPFKTLPTDINGHNTIFSSEFTGKNLVVDSFHLGAEFERNARQQFSYITVIDGMGRNHDCDLWIDPSSRQTTQHHILNSRPVTVLQGLDYVLTSPEYRLRRKTSEKKTNHDKQASRLYMDFGGANNEAPILLLLELLAECSYNGELYIAASLYDAYSSSPLENLPFLLISQKRTSELASLLQDTDAVIGAGGVSSWERCIMGVPALNFAFSSNQRHVCQVIKENSGGICFDRKPQQLPRDELRDAISTLLDPNWQARTSKNCIKILDGLGVERLADYLCNMIDLK